MAEPALETSTALPSPPTPTPLKAGVELTGEEPAREGQLRLLSLTLAVVSRLVLTSLGLAPLTKTKEFVREPGELLDYLVESTLVLLAAHVVSKTLRLQATGPTT